MAIPVLLIGAGRRIRNNFIPAFNCLTPQFRIGGVHSRTAANRTTVARSIDAEPVAELTEVSLRRFEIAVVSVTPKNVVSVLTRLHRHGRHLGLVMDTPVTSRQHTRVARMLSDFSDTRVAEDFMNFPPFELIRRALADGWIGNVQSIDLYQSAYRYHGLALIRSLCDWREVQSVRRLQQTRRQVTVDYVLRGGVKARMGEPYSRAEGQITVVGSSGTISSLPTADIPNVVQKPQYRISVSPDSRDVYCIGGNDREIRYELPHLDRLRSSGFDLEDRFNLLKTLGLIRVLESLANTNSNSQYSYRDGIYDGQLSHWASRRILQRWPWQPRQPLATYRTVA